MAQLRLSFDVQPPKLLSNHQQQMSFISRYLWRKKPTAEIAQITREGGAGLKTLTGRFGVGFLDVEWQDLERLSVPEADTKLLGHELPFVLARIYYPTAKQPEFKELGTWLPSSQYFPGYGYFLRWPTLVSSGIGRLLAANVKLFAAEGKPLLPIDLFGQEKFPVAIFSHGLAGIRTTYSTLCCELASRGVIVVALEHRDGSASMTIDQKGRVFPYQAGPSGMTLPMVDYEFRAAQLRHRLGEFASTAAFLEDINTTGTQLDSIVSKESVKILKHFQGRLLMERLILIGHSFGAGTCLAAAQQLRNVSCCIAWDPWMFPMPQPKLQMNRTDIDTLVVLNEKFTWPENDFSLHQFMEAMRESKQLLAQVRLRGCGHMDQSDLASIIPSRIIQLLRPGSSTPTNPHTILQINVDLAAAHLAESLPMYNFEEAFTLSELESSLRRPEESEANLENSLQRPEESETKEPKTTERLNSAKSIVQVETFVNY